MADELETITAENGRLKQEISGLRERLEQFEDLEGSIRAALVHAEQAANDLRQSAVQEAEDLRESSRREVESLQQSLQRQAESLRQSANREAELTLQEARVQAQQIIAEASARTESLQESYETLRDVKRRFSGDFRQLLEGYLKAIDTAETAGPTWNPYPSGRSASDRGNPEDELPTGGAVAGEDDQVTSIPVSDLEDFEDPGAHRNAEAEKDPEVEEPEFDPSSLGNESPGEEQFPGDTGAAEEVDREEPMPDGGARSEDAAEGDWEAADGESSPESEDDENRMFRASRYLRRRE